ncbi:conserved oligomeric Golgi complex subunit [Achlya hypogyna]|uniref:Conserved oligomeric Golgi complex subunit 4 n=1 Tax=Achlya hypogyna TaxID=1202772 RepID=A0A1V9YC74_ACHHY|nr:conserved oligomeric Golgi complex subunit [Achlya hypogyna]
MGAGDKVRRLREELAAVTARQADALSTLERYATLDANVSGLKPQSLDEDGNLKVALWTKTQALLETHLYTTDAASIDVLRKQTKHVGTAIAGAHDVAEKMTRDVRRLGRMQERVKASIERSDGILRVRQSMQRLQACMNERNYKDAAACLQDLRTIEALAIPIDVGDKLRMNSAENDIRDAIERQMDAALRQKDEGAVLRLGSIFEPMQFAEEGVTMVLAFASSQLSDRLEPTTNLDRASVVDLTGHLIHVFNAVAESTLRFETLMLQSFSSVRGAERLLSTVYGIGSPVAVRILNAYMATRALAETVNKAKAAQTQEANAAGKTPDVDWNPLLNELAVVLQHSQTYERFVRARDVHFLSKSGAPASLLPSFNASPLTNVVQELAAYYCALEDVCLSASTRKALAMEEVRSIALPGAQALLVVSSVLDEVFYVARNCSCRALATGHVDSACGVLNLVANLLQTAVFDLFSVRVQSIPRDLRDAGPAPGLLQSSTQLRDHVQTIATLGKKMTSRNMATTPPASSSGPPKPPAVAAPPVTLNSIDTSVAYLAQLQATLEAETKAAFSDPLPAQIKSCLLGLEETAKAYKGLLDAGIKHVTGVFQPRLAAGITPLVKKAAFDLTDAMFAANEANDPFAGALVAQLRQLLDPFEASVASATFEQIVDAMAIVTAELVESLVLTKLPPFNQLGALQFEKDVRLLTGYFGEKTQYSRAHHVAFGTLRQCVMVLSVDVPDDVLEFYGRPTTRGVVDWKLSAARVVELLQARVEFTNVEIAALELS